MIIRLEIDDDSAEFLKYLADCIEIWNGKDKCGEMKDENTH
jgi:hypothetical protein